VALTLYNTLTRKKEDFVPLDKANVRMYVCGPTVYDFAHIGNARPAIVFDVLFRLLRHIYGESHVTYVRNITDVDDKINARAARDYPDLPLNEAISKVTKETEAQFHEDMHALGALDPSVEPRATAHIEQMKGMIKTLVANGAAYVAEDHVLFSVGCMPDYGKLSGRSLDEMIAGARVDVAPYKRDPMDFVLWKPSKPGEPSWPSPCGIEAPGRPGWHIECSAMAEAHLGETFDIHGGGIDLVFPHHENEIAQSRCAYHTPFMAKVWMHNGFLQVEGEKMAKSAGNFVTVHELLEDVLPTDSTDPEARKFVRSQNGAVVRLAMLMTSYRQPLDWTERRMTEARVKLGDWRQAVIGADKSAKVFQPLLDALCDDLNTPLAIQEMDRLAKQSRSGSEPAEAAAMLMAAMNFLGFESQTVGLEADGSLRRSIEAAVHGVDEARVAALINERELARTKKNFAKADQIRDELAAMGISLKDAKDPKTGELVTTWEVAR